MRAIAIFEVKSEATFEEGIDHFQVAIAEGHPYTGTLRSFNDPIDEESVSVRLQLWIDFEIEGDLSEASELAKQLCGHFINVVSIMTSCSLGRPFLLRIIDWTHPGPQMRDVLVMSKHPASDGPFDLLGPTLQERFERYGGLFAVEEVQSALRWYRLGLTQESIEDQFQCFWLCIETMANRMGPQQRVHDICQTCRGDLWCENCQTHPTHRPFPKQLIQTLITTIVRDDGTIGRMMTDARNTLLHGERLEVAARRHELETDRLVDMIGDIARFSVFDHVLRKHPELDGIEVPHAITVASRHLVLRLHMQTEFEVDQNGLPAGMGPDVEVKATRVPATDKDS